MEAEQLINDCLENLKKQGVALNDQDTMIYHGENDIIELKGVEFNFIPLKEVRPQQVLQLTHNPRKLRPLLVMARYITPKAKEALRNANINYIESSGNAFIQAGDIYIFIDTNPGSPPVHQKPGQAFTKAGIKVIYQFLCDPGLLNETYRNIAQRADTALGALPRIMDGLKQEGFLLKAHNGWMIENYEALLEKWITAYHERLQPALFVQRFQPIQKDFFEDWQDLQLAPETQWGGEPAGAMLTQYLKPATFTVYTTDPPNKLMHNFRWKPDPEGPVIAYKKFWKDQHNEHPTVHPVLVYADLINTHDPRCLETAQKIYDTHVKPIIRQSV